MVRVPVQNVSGFQHSNFNMCGLIREYSQGDDNDDGNQKSLPITGRSNSDSTHNVNQNVNQKKIIPS